MAEIVWRVARGLVCGLSVLGSTGCAPREATKERAAAEATSAAAPTLEFEPVAELLDEQGEPMEIPPWLLVMLSDGSVVVSQMGEPVVRRYDSTGTLVSTVGRSGEGPGEFRRIAALLLLPQDSIAVVDGTTRRITFLVNDTLRNAPASGRSASPMVNGRFVRLIGRFADGRWVGVTVPMVSVDKPGEQVVVDTPFVAAGASDSSMHRLLDLPAREAVHVVRNGQSNIVNLSLLAPRVVAVCDSGLIVADTSGIQVYDTRGALRQHTPRPVSRRALNAPPMRAGAMRRMLVEESRPALSTASRILLGRWFDAVDSIMDSPRVDATGAVWFSQLMPDTNRSAAFDVRGTPITSVQGRHPLTASRGRFAVSAEWDTLLESQRFFLRKSATSPPTSRPAGLGTCNAGYSI